MPDLSVWVAESYNKLMQLDLGFRDNDLEAQDYV